MSKVFNQKLIMLATGLV